MSLAVAAEYARRRAIQLAAYQEVSALAHKALDLYEANNWTLDVCCTEVATAETGWRTIRDRALYLCDSHGDERAERAMGC